MRVCVGGGGAFTRTSVSVKLATPRRDEGTSAGLRRVSLRGGSGTRGLRGCLGESAGTPLVMTALESAMPEALVSRTQAQSAPAMRHSQTQYCPGSSNCGSSTAAGSCDALATAAPGGPCGRFEKYRNAPNRLRPAFSYLRLRSLPPPAPGPRPSSMSARKSLIR